MPDANYQAFYAWSRLMARLYKLGTVTVPRVKHHEARMTRTVIRKSRLRGYPR